MEFRIFDRNWIDRAFLANDDVSSQQAAFPVENAYNGNRRSKVWRSNGFFDITSAINGIVFQEVDGVDLVATIPAAAYTSRTAFMAAIKAALELVGANTYTITNDATTGYRFRFQSSGGFFELRTSQPGFTSAGVLGLDTTDDFTGGVDYTADFLRINTSEWFVWDMGISSNPEAFALIGPKTKSLVISPSAALILEGNHTNDWTAPEFSTTIPYDDEILFKIQNGGLATTAYRYWRLYVGDQNPAGFIEVGAIYLGPTYRFTMAGMVTPFQNSPIDRSTVIYSESGQMFSDLKEKTAGFSFQANGVSSLEIEKIEEIFNRYGTGLPFFVSLDDTKVYSSSVGRKLKYVKFQSEPNIKNTSESFFSVSLSFLEQL